MYIYSTFQQLKSIDKNTKISILLNKAYGGFALSKKAYSELGLEWDGYGGKYNNRRGDPKLIEVAKKLGDRVSLTPGNIQIEEITVSDILAGHLDETDGYETITYKSYYDREPIINII